jgi:hexosaminidase
MKKALKIIGIILLVLLIGIAIAWFGFLKPKPLPISEEDRAAIHLMPLPAELKLGTGVFILDNSLTHEYSELSSPRLARAVERFYSKLSSQTGMELGQGTNKTLILECSGSEKQYPALGDDESYTITVSEKEIVVKASEETGMIYALESLLQLARHEEGAWVVPALSMNDQPRYSWRGVMIDACRHWIPKEVILRNLEAMGTLKMNVFHWHLTEYQGFRVESQLFPKLHEMGSGGLFYSQKEIGEIVEFAADRGIRVVPEFDLPGHSTSWFVGYPELASAPGPYEIDTTYGVLDPALDPTREEVYSFLEGFFHEMTGLFPDAYYHIGGDEVNPVQWNSNSKIQAYMKEHALEDAHALQVYFNIRMQKILEDHGKKMMGWDEIIHPDLPKDGIVVQTWRDHGSLWESARTGNKAILSAGYYLDYKKPASYHYNVDPAVIQGAVEIEIDSTNWRAWDCELQISDMNMEGAIYLFGEGEELRGIMEFMGTSSGFDEVTLTENLLAYGFQTNFGRLNFELELMDDSISGQGKLALFNLALSGKRSGGTDMEGGKILPEFRSIDPLTPEQEANILGGEACMWTEMADGTTIESRIWPRAAAVAEKLWSPQVLTDEVTDMYRRLMVMDNKLENLGLMHRAYRNSLLTALVPEPEHEPLQILTNLLQEDEMFARMDLYDPRLYTTTPLNRMVDIALPESYEAYRFGQDVDLWIESEDAAARERMIMQLEIWSVNNEQLAPAFENNERLLEVQKHSEHLSQLGLVGLLSLTNPASLSGKDDEMKELFVSASESYGATNLPITQHVQKLVQSAIKN